MRTAAPRARAHRTGVGPDRRSWSGRSTTSIISRRSHCRSCGRWPRGRCRRRGPNGSISSTRWRRACCCGPTACCVCSRTCGRWAPSDRSRSTKRRGSSRIGWRRVEADAPLRRYGRVLVGSPSQLRGRSFDVVFIPALAERMFPQKPREDPLLLDEARQRLDAGPAAAGGPRGPGETAAAPCGRRGRVAAVRFVSHRGDRRGAARASRRSTRSKCGAP